MPRKQKKQTRKFRKTKIIEDSSSDKEIKEEDINIKTNSIDIETNEEEITNSEIEDIIKFNNLEINEPEKEIFDIYENKEEKKENNENNSILEDLDDIYKILNKSTKEINQTDKTRENKNNNKTQEIIDINKNINMVNKQQFIPESNNFRINQKILIKDLNITPEIENFSYRCKDYYLYTPAKQRSGNKISWKCKIYRSNEHKLKGSKRLCYGQISLYKSSNSIYLEKNHSEYCDSIKKIIPDNIENIDEEIFKKCKLEAILLKKIENNPLISYEEFSKEAKTYYDTLKCNFTIFPTTFFNLYKKIRNDSGLFNIEYVIKNNLTVDKFPFFRKANYEVNPFKKNHISKYLIWASDYHLNKMKKSTSFIIDGTFIRPFGYYQTLIIMYLENDSNKYIPGCYILLNSKTEFNYKESLKFLKSKLINNETENIKLTTITCDFEIALINSISVVFNNIHKVGCYFHYKQCLRRNAQKLGLMNKSLVIDTNKLINCELGIFPFKNFKCNNDILKVLDDLKKQYKDHTELINYYKKEWLKYFENKMLCYNYIPKKIRSTSYLENYNGLLLKLTHNKKILTWPEYINLLINEEHKYKLKIINYESSILNNNNIEEKLISNNIKKKK